MIAEKSLPDEAFDELLARVKKVIQRVRLRWTGKPAPKRRRKKRSASSKAAASLA